MITEALDLPIEYVQLFVLLEGFCVQFLDICKDWNSNNSLSIMLWNKFWCNSNLDLSCFSVFGLIIKGITSDTTLIYGGWFTSAEYFLYLIPIFGGFIRRWIKLLRLFIQNSKRNVFETILDLLNSRLFYFLSRIISFIILYLIMLDPNFVELVAHIDC